MLTRGIWCSTISISTKIKLYHVYIQPVLMYGSETWSMTRALQDKIDAFDNKCLRSILRISYTDHVRNTEVRLRAESPPLPSQLIQTRRLRLFGHLAIMDTTTDVVKAHQVSTRGLSKDWKRPRGRPRRTWLRTVESDLQPFNLGLSSAWRHAQDRTRWRQLMKTATLQQGACS